MSLQTSVNSSFGSVNGTNLLNFDFTAWLKSSNISFSDLSVLPDITTNERVAKIAMYVLAIVLALTLNSLIIVVIIRTKSLRTKFNMYVLNLACVNILIAVTCMWLHVVTNLNPTRWPLGPFFCKINTFLQVLVVTVSVFTLTVVVIDRFFAALFPRCLVITQAHQVTLIVLIWVFGAVLALPWLLYSRFVEYDWVGGHEVLCQAHFPSEESRKAYITTSVVIGYVLPVLIMFVLLIVTMVKFVPPKVPATEQRKSFNEMRQKAMTMILTVLIIFFVCWSPPEFERLWDIYRYKGPGAKVPEGIHALTYASFYIAYFSSCVYPLVYIGFNECFRHAAKNLLCRRMVLSAVSVYPEEPGPSCADENQSSPKLQNTAEDDCFTEMSTP
ncbi:prolactin-releasing peptide receptor-like [Ylistrum balloti]|uniref:prolactin-releasing peptide receptor-like n=1 Tax=Ylistrum balloti TaxID=509963 RepID=UPI002905AF2C|nr:prolactin-releasing peptide receptor-like [Ylistrum balloti]